MTFRQTILLGLLPISMISPFSLQATETPYQFDDWHEVEAAERLCRGFYLEPEYPYDINAAPFDSYPIILEADKTSIQSNGESVLEDNLSLVQGNRLITANQGNFFRQEATQSIHEINIQGDVSLKEPGLRLDGHQATLWLPENKKQITDSHFRLYSRHARGQADTITVTGDNQVTLNQARYTTCGPKHQTWHIQAKRVELYRDKGRGEAYQATFYFKNVPFFYSPYANFPIDNQRKSGFLYPSFGTTLRSGTEFSVPYYWNIAPNYDLTITPKAMSKRGIDLQNEFRYLTSSGHGFIKASLLPDDRAYRVFKANHLNYHPGFSNSDPRVKALNKTSNHRFALYTTHRHHFSKHWLLNIDYQYVKDPNYFMDLGNDIGTTSTTQLLQMGQLDYESNWLQALLKVQSYQTLHPFDGPVGSHVYEYVPQLAFKTYSFYLPFGFQSQIRGSWSRFTHKDNAFTGEKYTVGDRLHLRPSLSLPFVTPGWFFKPKFQLDLTQYQLTLGDTDKTNRKPTSPFRMVPMSSIDTGLIFERSLKRYPLIQTLEPRLYYLNVPYKDQNNLPHFDSSPMGFDFNQLFRDNHFSSVDRVQDTHQLSLALSSRLLDQESFAQKFHMSIGQSFYFRNRDVSLCDRRLNPSCRTSETRYYQRHSSLLVGQMGLEIQPALTSSAQFLWDPYKKHVDVGSLTLKYQPHLLDVANLSYQFSRNNSSDRYARLHQIDASVAKRINPYWRAVMRYNHNLSAKKTNQVWGGIERQSCCFAVRFLATRFSLPTSHPSIKEYDNAFFIQFVLKGLSSFGDNNLTSIIQKGISGYEWLEGFH